MLERLEKAIQAFLRSLGGEITMIERRAKIGEEQYVDMVIELPFVWSRLQTWFVPKLVIIKIRELPDNRG